MSIVLNILDAGGTLESYKAIITQNFNRSIVKITRHLPIDKVDVVIRDNANGIIPEIGIGGHAYGPYFLIVSLHSKRDNCRQVIEEELLGILAHELHHCLRYRSVGYGKTLLNSLISEGLATYFEREMTGTVRPWATALTQKEIHFWMNKAQKEFVSVNYDHRAWFFGSKEKKIPRWTGYSLGYKVVGDYLTKHPKMTAAKLHAKKAEAFIR